MTRHARRLFAVIALAGLGTVTAGQPASAFFGSFDQSCHDVHVYGGDAFMTAYCRRVDGSWHYTQIANCGGYGVHNQDGHLRCGA